jgi:hypothetical protein
VKAEFNVRGAEGTWRSFVPKTEGRANPCLERQHPVQASSWRTPARSKALFGNRRQLVLKRK